jgi:hypothetical protein
LRCSSSSWRTSSHCSSQPARGVSKDTLTRALTQPPLKTHACPLRVARPFCAQSRFCMCADCACSALLGNPCNAPLEVGSHALAITCDVTPHRPGPSRSPLRGAGKPRPQPLRRQGPPPAGGRHHARF